MRRWAMITVVAVGALLASSCSSSSRSSDEPTMMGLGFDDYTHEHEPFAEDLFAEQASLPQIEDGELSVLPGDYNARYTHVADYARTTYRSEAGPSVWFFGGSALFGIGQRDEHTIPSEVARLAEAEGTPIRARTYGFPSYASWQEVGLLRRVLAEGTKPDLVVFYHGTNDLGAVCRQLALGVTPDGLGTPLMTREPSTPKRRCVDDPDATGRLIAAATGRAMAEARMVLGETPVIEVWQPFASTRRPTTTDRPLIERLGLDDATGLHAQAGPYRAALRHTDPAVVDLTDALDGTDEPIFFDWAHTNEEGARLIAEAMWERSLRSEVARLTDAGS